MEELRAALAQSNLVTIVTEGRDDYEIMRNLQQEVGGGDCLPAGGKNAVLSLHADVHKYSCPGSAYIVDADLWNFSGIPAGLAASPRLIITDGYSIENDALRDCQAEKLIYASEQDAYQKDIENVILWFASGVTAKLSDDQFNFDIPLSDIIERDTNKLTALAKVTMATWPASDQLIQTISADYERLLRGKTWLRVLSKYLCANGRAIQHPPSGLLEKGMRSGGAYSSKIIDATRNALLIR